MTKDQLHIAFKIAMDKNATSIAFGGCPAFLDEEIDYWLNQGMYQEVSNKFTGLNTLKQPFEQSVKRIHDLEQLVVTDTNIALEKNSNNECVAKDVLNGKLFFVEGMLHFNGKSSNLILLDHASVKPFKETYDNKPYVQTPVATIENNDICIYYDPISMESDSYSMDLTYVKIPTLNDFPDYMQYEIVNRAVELALENIESQRVQTKSQLNQLDE